jgi:flagellar biosynthesis/type III secretory pathway protein FliH
MDDNKSRELLQQLHDEINNLKAVDENSSKLLRDIDSDIRALLERSGEHPMEVHPSIIERMEDAVDQFEVTHPELTALISKVMDSLSIAGI